MMASTSIITTLLLLAAAPHYVDGLGCALQWQDRCARAFNAVKKDIDEAVTTAFDDVFNRYRMPSPALTPVWSENTGLGGQRNRELFSCSSTSCPLNWACAIYCGYGRRSLYEKETEGSIQQVARRENSNLLLAANETIHSNLRSPRRGRELTSPKEVMSGDSQEVLLASNSTNLQQDAGDREAGSETRIDEEALRIEITGEIYDKLTIVKGKTQCARNPKCLCGFETLKIEVDAKMGH